MTDLERREEEPENDPYNIDLGNNEDLISAREDFANFQREVVGTATEPGKGQEVGFPGPIDHLKKINNPNHLTQDALRVYAIIAGIRHKIIDRQLLTPEEEKYLTTHTSEWIPEEERVHHDRDRIDRGCVHEFYQWADNLASGLNVTNLNRKEGRDHA